jgi:outer membrane protein OmpA-like peptidoglycan-associated protein
VRSVCALIFLSAMSLPSFSQNYYFVIGAFESESADVSTFAKNFIGNSADSLYAVSNDGTRAHFYVLKSAKPVLPASKAKTIHELSSNTSSNAGTSPEFDLQGSIEQPAVYSASAGNSAGENAPSMGGVPAKPRGKFFKFTVDTYDGRTMSENVHQVDFEKQKDLQTYQTETYIDLLRPQMREPMTVVCGVFGYKPVEKVINFYNPAMTEGAYRDETGSWVIPYTLERVEAGDVSIMYNVGFHKDAVSMTPESQKDLEELVALMNSNPNYEITVHAYCNGKSKRKIRTLNEQLNYFDLNETVEVVATAKQLTSQRADAVRSYLAENGIDPARVKIFAWGGHDMLVDERDENSKINDRIEIEIMND